MTENDTRLKLAFALAYHRKRANLTIYDVGKMIGKSGKTIDAWEHGRGQPDAEHLLKLCAIYGVPSVGAFFGEDKMPVSDDEYTLLKMYRSLNIEGKQAISNHALALVTSGLYKKGE